MPSSHASRTAGLPEPPATSVRVGVMFATPWPILLLAPTPVGHAAVGAFVSIRIGKSRYCAYGCTTVAAAWSNFVGDCSVTFGAGEAGAGDGIDAIRTVSRVAPIGSSTSSSPTARPVVLASRSAVAPAVAAWLSPPLMMPPGRPGDTLPAASIARRRRLLVPSLVNGPTVPPVTGRSTQVTPPSVEYWSLATPTLSVADTLTVTGALVYQLLLPVEIDVGAKPYAGSPLRWTGADGVVPTVSTGDVVSGACAPAVGAASSAAETTAAAATRRCNPTLPS